MTSTRRYVAIGLLVVLVALAGCSQVSDGGAGETATETETSTATATQTATANATQTATQTATTTATQTATATATTTATATATQTVPQPTATVEPAELGLDVETRDVSECGVGCWDVTFAIIDTDGTGASNVSADIEITSGGEPIWSGAETITSVSANGSTERTVELELGLTEARTLMNNDNQVTITTVLVADGKTATVVEERQF